MTSAGFVARLAWRTGRAARRRLLLLTASVVAGVGALVAVNSFTANLTAAVATQAQELLGADLSFTGRGPALENRIVRRLVDSLKNVGGDSVQVAHSASFAAMAYQPRAGGARLVQLRSVDPGWPWYGAITTNPAGAWAALQRGGAVVDPSLLTALDASIGDTIALGDGRFPIVGTVVSVPGDIGLQLAFGQRVYIATSAVASTHLLVSGSRAQYETFLRLPHHVDPQLVSRSNAATLRGERFAIHTVADDRDSLTRGLIRLSSYLGLVALAALLLGGLGVASAVHVYIRQQLDTIAVLRCLGATSQQLIATYLLQALTMGALGSVAGALLGVGLQQFMPYVVRDFLPVGVDVFPSLPAIAMGIASGLWTAFAFTLLPLLGLRTVTPLATLRRDVEVTRAPWDPLRVVAAAVIPLSVIALAAVQVGSLLRAVIFTGGCAGVLVVLWLSAIGVTRVVRRLPTHRWWYLLRQGLANLHRPANQTVTVILALGFGGFILATLFTAQQNLLRVIQVEDTGGKDNLVFFDIQTSQQRIVDSVLGAASLTHTPYVPIVPMRIRELKGVPVTQILSRDTTPRDAEPAKRPATAGPSPWAVRREFRSTFRGNRSTGERITAGRWFDTTSHADGRNAAHPVEVSVEGDVAKELNLALGDSITWDVQGVPIYSRVTSFREVNWARFEPNFFVVFAPGALESAPQSWVTMARAPDAAVRGTVQRTIAEHAANVTSIDLGEIQHAIASVVDRIIAAIRFMALFSLATGTVVLVGAIATSRWQRLREGTLLRTLGATRSQVLTILATEYAALGLAAALVASLLAAVAGFALAHWLFDTHFVVPIVSMLVLAAALVLLTTVVGLWTSLDVLRRAPLEVLRDG